MNIKYTRQVFMAAMAAIALAFLLLIIKFCAWWYTGSVSVLAALIDSLVDIAASLTNLLVIRYAMQPADSKHAFGHGKAESLAVLVQSLFICGSALFLFFTGFQHIAAPQELKEPLVLVIVTFIALFSTLILVTFQRWVVQNTQSQAIRADMLHYQSDIVINSAILFALVLSWLGCYWADALCALNIGIWILYSAWRMACDAVQVLLDRSLPVTEYQAILKIVATWPGICGVHDIRTRQAGPTRFIQLHLEMEDHLPLCEAHSISNHIEQALLMRFPGSDVIIHQDPCSVVSQEHQRTIGS
ncbi:CDF family cation-efflux transporter FieF [Candidatus Erwinia haradaeae]|uniref:Cation-efflux pump FieF n=1 Tax=Candidatus Erwinia haradaeae TaxID=1922217 RepID=A0A451D2X5_9GAMM|nr:CDF family cation-efflux transporter FieF [Candidatus Erwinia haradaeae]VFP79990.1 Ferrous-iron efflux pump FieF [Candidatus Erwinia haradaeae]